MFTFVDGIVAFVLLASAAMAFMRGFVHEVLAVAAWVGAGIVALYGFPIFRPWFNAQVGMPVAADILTGVCLFLVPLLVFSLITKAISNRVRNSALNSVDSSLGFVFGLLRGAVVVCLAYMVAVWVIAPQEPPSWLANAKTRPWLQRGADMLERLRPGSMPETLPGEREKRTATGNLDEDSRRGNEVINAYRELPIPQPVQPAADTKGQRQGYDSGQRREMDRLFQTNK